MSMAHLYRTLRMCALQRRPEIGRLSADPVCSNRGRSAERPVELGSSMKNTIKNKRLIGASLVLAALAVAGGVSFLSGRGGGAQAGAVAAAPTALPVSVSVVAPSETVPWDEFSGRLE